jgi:hypothetical protein
VDGNDAEEGFVATVCSMSLHIESAGVKYQSSAMAEGKMKRRFRTPHQIWIRCVIFLSFEASYP